MLPYFVISRHHSWHVVALCMRHIEVCVVFELKCCSSINRAIDWGRILQATGLSAHPGVLQQVQELQETCCSPHLLGFLVDFYEDALETNNSNAMTDTLNKALEVNSSENILSTAPISYLSDFYIYNDWMIVLALNWDFFSLSYAPQLSFEQFLDNRNFIKCCVCDVRVKWSNKHQAIAIKFL